MTNNQPTGNMDVDPNSSSEQNTFFTLFGNYVKQQEERHAETQNTIVRMLDFMNNQSNQSNGMVGAPRSTKTDTEFLIESLSKSITEFSYDIDSNSTFENWFNRFKDLFLEDAKNLDDKAKVRLLIRKLDTQSHSKYVDFILPSVPSDFSFAETVSKLTKIFGRHDSLFNLRFKCFQLQKTDDMNNLSYMGLVNKSCEKF